ncbi:DUF2630 family protein [Amycolatopsis taiwanensis]|uniref:DUF2630 domain-containing protein n=1 Tax=Amycolatopsis taiwanensis TaxID=342230 RepID=A0A9W6VL98_9PSEU|nr:DUF2630 family protein [Amycolatopsis taiwanensis]GLY71227.1 hypothetical protein Atai01_78460 [Amycolatopsis taiwanensis]
MADNDIIANIDELIAEEHRLRSRAHSDGLDDTERERMRQLEEHLDQCWDLLRQRRARREFGEDPAAAQARPVREVESYQQ